jgi:2-desacetyl-2-hydroxyethyl bacteriochlorophyllide A dehydrogenase
VHGRGLSLDELALVEPLAIGAHGVSRAQIKPGESVLVVGAGPIGLCTLAFAKIAGAKTISLDIDESRLRFCKEKLNVDHTINASSAEVTEQLSTFTNGDMPSVVIDATGNLSAINNAFQYMSFGGRYVLIGLQKNEVQFSHPEFHKREGMLMSSRNAHRADFEQVISSIRDGLITPLDFITHRIPFAQAKEAMETKLGAQNDLIKAMISFD